MRIAGKIKDEIYRNGGGNWNGDYKKMTDTLGIYLSSGNALSAVQLQKVEILLSAIRKQGDADDKELHFMCQMATEWVLLNPDPVLLGQTKYKR